jgi:hypothetical protein
MRRRGGEARASQTRGDSSWGKYLAERKRLKRYGAVGHDNTIEARIAAIEHALRAAR